MKHQYTLLSLFVVFLWIAFFCWPLSAVFALTPREIMQKVDDRYDGDNSISETTMILIDRRGNKRIRKLKSFSKDYGKDTKSILFFRTPADVKNTSFLSYDWDDDEKDDDQWLYLPALRKVKRIASDDKSGSFMGSDFTYSDMSGVQISRWNYRFLKENVNIEGQDCWLIEGKPKKEWKKKVIKETGYLKSQVWVRKDIFMTIRGKFWVKKGKKLKFLQVKDIEEIDGVWTARQVQMTTKKGKRTEHATVIQTNKIQYNDSSVTDSYFTTQRMERGAF